MIDSQRRGSDVGDIPVVENEGISSKTETKEQRRDAEQHKVPKRRHLSVLWAEITGLVAAISDAFSFTLSVLRRAYREARD